MLRCLLRKVPLSAAIGCTGTFGDRALSPLQSGLTSKSVSANAATRLRSGSYPKRNLGATSALVGFSQSGTTQQGHLRFRTGARAEPVASARLRLDGSSRSPEFRTAVSTTWGECTSTLPSRIELQADSAWTALEALGASRPGWSPKTASSHRHAQRQSRRGLPKATSGLLAAARTIGLAAAIGWSAVADETSSALTPEIRLLPRRNSSISFGAQTRWRLQQCVNRRIGTSASDLMARPRINHHVRIHNGRNMERTTAQTSMSHPGLS
ncbi:MAG: hypothetical protein QM765_30555 [Myxococcales bacterium]